MPFHALRCAKLYTPGVVLMAVCRASLGGVREFCVTCVVATATLLLFMVADGFNLVAVAAVPTLVASWFLH